MWNGKQDPTRGVVIIRFLKIMEMSYKRFEKAQTILLSSLNDEDVHIKCVQNINQVYNT